VCTIHQPPTEAMTNLSREVLFAAQPPAEHAADLDAKTDQEARMPAALTKSSKAAESVQTAWHRAVL